MKKQVSILLCAVMLCTLTVPALAIEPLRCDPPLPPPAEPSVEPTPPEWIAAEHYLVFPGDEVYLPENWAKVLELRVEAANGGLRPEEDNGQWRTGEGSAGLRYEMGLVRLKNAENEGLTTPEALRTFAVAGWHLRRAREAWYQQNGGLEDTLYYRLRQYGNQASRIGWGESVSYQEVDVVTKALGIEPEAYFDGPYMELMPEEKKAKTLESLAAYREKESKRLKIILDGLELDMDTQPVIHGGRTMVPIRTVAEMLGAVVTQEEGSDTVTMTRAGRVARMTIGSTAATVDGRTVRLDAAPYISGGQTMASVRFVTDCFGQTMDWDGGTNTVAITEDKSVVGESNMEAWALPMGAMLTRQTIQASIKRFGLWPRGETIYYPTSGVSGIAPPGGGDYEELLPCELCRKTLSQSWNVNSREDLILTVCSMTVSGHNASFLANAAYINSLSPAQYNQFRDAYEINTYMAPYTKQLSQKWGNRGILCWDLFRMSNLVQWGYVAGYLTYAEALALLEPAARLLCENFSSWDEAYENYLDGYNWWARNNVLDDDIWDTYRGRVYQEMREFAIFDDSLFKTGVISVPGVTAEELLESVLG